MEIFGTYFFTQNHTFNRNIIYQHLNIITLKNILVFLIEK